MVESIIFWLVGLILAPLIPGVIQRVKAIFAGRRGASVLQLYFDIVKLLHKGAVYSRTTTFVFRAGPVVGLGAMLTASLLVPQGGWSAPISFAGDLILFAYLLGLLRFITVLAALDTGSSFEGMGGSREVWISVLAEPAMFLSFAAMARLTGAWSLSMMTNHLSTAAWSESVAVMALVCAALFMVLLAENARIPVDDPNTHLELTMIHEVMALDHGGVDLAFILYGGALKLWFMSAILVNFLLPAHSGMDWLDRFCGVIGIAIVAIAIGIVESSMARLRLSHISRFLVGSLTFAAIALILSLGGW